MCRRLHYQFITFIFLLLIPAIRSEISTGVRLYNNQWQKTWLITPAPELTFSGRWVALQIDGALGTYSPPPSSKNYITQSRISMIPMFHLSLGPVETHLGYGYAYQFRREEIFTASDEWVFNSFRESSGEFRFLLGLGFSLSDHLNCHFDGGYHYLNSKALAYSFGIRVGFKQCVTQITHTETSLEQRESLLKSVESTIEDSNLNKNNYTSSELERTEKFVETPTLKTVCMVGTQDKFINELNSTLEAALVKKGISVLSWDKIKSAVRQQYNGSRDTPLKYSAQDDFFMDDMQIIFNGSELFPLDAVIETKLRYIYETYGGEILVNAAYIRLLHPKTGEVLGALEYDKPESSFSECKAALTSRLIEYMYPLKK